jgi:hypothetical protein
VSSDFTISDVLEWARTKPADERYDYVSSCRCALAQFLIATRDPNARAFPGSWIDGLGQDHPLDSRIDDAAQGSCPNDRTFGKLVERLEELSA